MSAHWNAINTVVPTQQGDTSGGGGGGPPTGPAGGRLTGTYPNPGVLDFVGDAGAGGANGAVPAPAAGDTVAFKYLNADGTWMQINADQILPGFSIASFAKTNPNPGTVLYRRGDTLVGTTIGATYVSGPPSAAALVNVLGGSVGGGDVDPAAWTFVAPFAAGSQPANVKRDGLDAGADPTWTITLNATGTASDSDSTTITWTRDVYYGVSSDAGPLTEAQVEALAGSALATTRNRTITVSPANEYVYYAFPQSYGAATFTLNGFPAAFEAPLALSLTNVNGITSTYSVYRSTNLLTGTNLAFVVT